MSGTDGNKVQFDFIYQSKIIYLLINDKNFLQTYASLIKPEYFTDFTHQALFRIVLEYFKKYNELSTLEVLLEELEKFPDPNKIPTIINSLESILSTDLEDINYYKDRLVEFCRRQSTLTGIKNAIEKVKEGDLDSILPDLEKSINIGIAVDEKSLGSYYWDNLDKEQVHLSQIKVPTMMGEAGSGGLDDTLRGGLARGNVGMVMMPTGNGKSIFLLNVCGNAVLQGYNAVYITLELSERTISDRFNIFFSGMFEDDIDKLSKADFTKKMMDMYKGWKLGKLLVKNFPNLSVTVRDIEAYLLGIKNRSGWFPDLIIIDYHDTIKPPNPKKDTHEQLKDVSDELKSFAQRNDVPVWTASQVNKDAISKKVANNHNAANSYAKTFPLDCVFTSVPRVDELTGTRIADIYCSKNRQGIDWQTSEFEIDLMRMRYIFRPKESKLGNSLAAYKRLVNKGKV